MALLLPRALLVAIRLQSLPALVLVHLQTTFLFQIAHGDWNFAKDQRAVRSWHCKAEFKPRARAPAVVIS